MTDTNNEQEERRLARQDGWSSEHFRFREDQMGNLHVARSEWIGPEALSFNLALLPELLDQLDSIKEDVPTTEPVDETTQPTPPVAPVQGPTTPEPAAPVGVDPTAVSTLPPTEGDPIFGQTTDHGVVESRVDPAG